MIKILMVERHDLSEAYKQTFEIFSSIKKIDVQIDIKNSLKGKSIPDGYDIYALHTSLIRPTKEIARLRRDNPSSYIMMRNTIQDTLRDKVNFPSEVISSANEWYDYPSWKLFSSSLEQMSRTWEI